MSDSEKNTKEIFDQKIPVYISLTSIFKRQDILLQTLQFVMKQTRLPDKIFLYLSEDPYILDTGFKDKKITHTDLLKFISDNSIIDVKWVKNSGPYRKLLPILKEKWDENCIILTIDDDLKMDENSIKNLISDYNKYKCVISYRGFTPLFNIDNFDYKKHNNLQNLSLYNFSTNGAGTLWKPSFFHKTKGLIFDEKIYLNTCEKQDDIWFYLIRILNGINCYIGNKPFGRLNDRSFSTGLWLNFNSKNNLNTKVLKNTVNKLRDLGYTF